MKQSAPTSSQPKIGILPDEQFPFMGADIMARCRHFDSETRDYQRSSAENIRDKIFEVISITTDENIPIIRSEFISLLSDPLLNNILRIHLFSPDLFVKLGIDQHFIDEDKMLSQLRNKYSQYFQRFLGNL